MSKIEERLQQLLPEIRVICLEDLKALDQILEDVSAVKLLRSIDEMKNAYILSINEAVPTELRETVYNVSMLSDFLFDVAIRDKSTNT